MTLREYLAEMSESGAEMARALGVSRGMISLIAQGRNQASLGLALEIQGYTRGRVRAESVRPDMGAKGGRRKPGKAWKARPATRT